MMCTSISVRLKSIIDIIKLFQGFKLLLSQLYKEGEINSEFKNMNKPTFLKLEKFIIEKIQAKVNMDNIEVEIKGEYSIYTQ